MFLINPYILQASGNSYYLDSYGTPVVWYEMVKRFSSYSGDCIRVRRSSDNAEQNIGFVNDLLDTTSLLSFVGAGNGFVTTFYNQVGVNNLTQPSASSQPQIVSSGALITRNGFVTMKYDGTNDYLQRGAPVINTTSTSYFSVAQNDISNNRGVIHSQSLSSASTIISSIDRSGTKENLRVISSSYVAELSVVRNDANLRLQSSFIDASKNMSAFDNGVTGGTATYIGTPINNDFALGVTGVWLNGSINCFGAYNSDNSSNRVAIETILNNYYNIY